MITREFNVFAEARQLIESDEDRAAGVEAMVRLAFEASSMKLRAWAATYMMENLGVEIRSAEDEAAPKAGRI